MGQLSFKTMNVIGIRRLLFLFLFSFLGFFWFFFFGFLLFSSGLFLVYFFKSKFRIHGAKLQEYFFMTTINWLTLFVSNNSTEAIVKAFL